MPDSVGYAWLRENFEIETVQQSPVVTRIGPSRIVRWIDGVEHRIVVEQQRPEATLSAHLTFALKNEGVDLELLSRLFAEVAPDDLEAWIRREPTGQYARRAGFFYEWITGKRLDVPDVVFGNYVEALDPAHDVTLMRSTNVTRWRVRDNLLGSPQFCTTVRRTAAVESMLAYDIAARVDELEGQFGSDILMRSAVWLSLKESRASFAIENEGDQEDRIRRFAAVIGARTGNGADPTTPEQLLHLQKEILGKKATNYGFRKSPIFVGERQSYGEHVHYIGPHWEQVEALLQGLNEMKERSRGINSIVRASLLSFGFVYIHPMVDGNGRISRFLINDVLRRDGVLRAPYILPVSATLQDKGFRPHNYDFALERFSQPLMERYREDWRFGAEQIGEDGVPYNLEFDSYEDALHAWKFPNLTSHVEFMGAVVKHTLEHEMRIEAQYLKMHHAARVAVKNVIEAPDPIVDRIIRAVRENNGTLSGKLRKEVPLLEDEERGLRVVEAIRDAFPWLPKPSATEGTPQAPKESDDLSFE